MANYCPSDERMPTVVIPRYLSQRAYLMRVRLFSQYEVFDCRDGSTLFYVRSLYLARLLSRGRHRDFVPVTS